MSSEAPAGVALHASAVAIGGLALLILGRSRSGKSRLTAALVALAGPRRPIELVGDDRILLLRTARGLQARPHPRIAGFIERRGLGLVAMPWRERADVVAIARLDDHVAPGGDGLANLSCLALVGVDEAERAAAVMAWWHAAVENLCSTAEPVPR